MRTSTNLYWALALFFGVVAVAYTIWTAIEYGAVEWVGVVALTLLVAFSAFIGFYLMLVFRAQGGPLPEDVHDANIDDGDPEVGHFSPWSWWPVALAFGAGLVLLGLAVGAWIFVIGLPVVFVALVGWVFEYYRGNFAH